MGLHFLDSASGSQMHTFPEVRATQPIGATNEVFGNQRQWIPPSLHFAFTNEPDCRLQLISSDDQWMCQVQRDRLVVNWRKRKDEYPRFDATWKRFRAAWIDWCSFLSSVGIPQVIPRVWDLTYVNRVSTMSLCESPSDWPQIFPGLWHDFTSLNGASLTGFQGKWVWEYAHPTPAKLFVECRPGRSSEQPPRDVLLMTLTARGPVDFNEGLSDDHFGKLQSIENGIDYGHTVIVTTFDQLASATAKKAWERHENRD